MKKRTCKSCYKPDRTWQAAGASAELWGVWMWLCWGTRECPPAVLCTWLGFIFSVSYLIFPNTQLITVDSNLYNIYTISVYWSVVYTKANFTTTFVQITYLFSAAISDFVENTKLKTWQTDVMISTYSVKFICSLLFFFVWELKCPHRPTDWRWDWLVLYESVSVGSGPCGTVIWSVLMSVQSAVKDSDRPEPYTAYRGFSQLLLWRSSFRLYCAAQFSCVKKCLSLNLTCSAVEHRLSLKNVYPLAFTVKCVLYVN